MSAEAMIEERSERCDSRRLGSGTFFEEFFAELELRGIAYAILHGYDELPDHIDSDIDYAVADADLAKIGPILAAVARRRGWVVAQSIRHELFAFFHVVIDPEETGNHLRLDVCSHFAINGCLLVRDEVLLAGRRRHERGFFVPSAASEFAYICAKGLAKNSPPSRYLPRLRELWAIDPHGTQRRFRELLGEPGCALDELLDAPPETWEPLRERLRSRHRFGARLRALEMGRVFWRVARPPGLHVAVLGPDGAGKSTLIENLRASLAPCFGAQRVFKFRPDLFGRIEPGTEPRPHARPPRSRLVSWAKVFYYFADWWLSWFAILLPARIRNRLLIFDRDFDDIVVDQRRYLVQGVGRLAGALRWFVPRPNLTFVLDADPRTVHARKPELPIDVLERQRLAYRKLAATGASYRVISAEQPAGEVARAVSREIIHLLGAREARRALPASKRLFDFAISVPALLLLAPLLAVIALLVAVKLGTPVIFRQTRPGLHGRPFTIYKFRTMTDARDDSGRLLPDAERHTRFGKWLRSTSLDELPELFNVLRGEMSLVGPRPLLMDYLPLYSAAQARRHEVLPGITGWAQINGRNAASWPQKFACDVWYVDHQSLWLDLKILALTVGTVLRREGITQPGRATADRFRGEQLETDTP